MARVERAVLPRMLLLMASSAAAAVQLTFYYPEEGNYSYIKIACVRSVFGDPLFPNQRPATFLRNNSALSANDFASLAVGEVEADIVFTAEQEGGFFCRTGGTAPVEQSDIHYFAGVSSLVALPPAV